MLFNNTPWYEYLVSKLILLLGSRKFWVLALAVATSYGLDISSDLQALLMLIAATVFATTQAWEDRSKA